MTTSGFERAAAADAGAFPCRSPSELRRRSVGNLLRMGHCAPTVMQTLLDASGAEAEWLVRLSAGLPGGIGNTGGECGGLTAPLLLLGLRYRRAEEENGLPIVVDRGHELLGRFTVACGTTQCRAIRGSARVPLRCIGVVRQAPGLCAATVDADGVRAVPLAARDAYRTVYAGWRNRGFHCADAVLERVDGVERPPQLRDATTAFMGGTLLTGMTCSALTAGVMALGLALAEIEHSRVRVLRMIATMAVGGDAFADDVNAFNRIMNLGHELARWFDAEHGSILCRDLTGCDFSTREDAVGYVEGDGIDACERIAAGVAARVGELVTAARAGA